MNSRQDKLDEAKLLYPRLSHAFVDYRMLKSLLKKTIDRIPVNDHQGEEDPFLTAIRSEFAAVENAYEPEMETLRARVASVANILTESRAVANAEQSTGARKLKTLYQMRVEAEDVRESILEFRQFVRINYDSIYRLLKRYDTARGDGLGALEIRNIRNSRTLQSQTGIRDLEMEIELICREFQLVVDDIGSRRE